MPTKLDPATIDAKLTDVPAWTVVDGKLHRELRFADFVEAWGFMCRVALVAERMNHHPEWRNVWASVTIDLETHDAGGLSALDFELAQAIDALVG